MKNKLLFWTGLLPLVCANASADLVYLEEFFMIADRSTLMISLSKDSSTGSDQAKISLIFGHGLWGKQAEMEARVVGAKAEFEQAMEKLAAYLNDPRRKKLSIQEGMRLSGLTDAIQLRAEAERAIINNLRQIASAAQQYLLEFGVKQVAYPDLLKAEYFSGGGPKPVAGEDYSGIVVTTNTTRISVRDRDGKVHMYEF